MTQPALQTLDLCKSFGSVRAAWKVSLSVQAGETLALLGPSGCGKSTVLRLIAGLEKPDSGRVEIAGQDVTNFPPEARHIGLVFQDYALFPHLDVLGNVSYGPRVRGTARAQAEAQAREALALVGLGDLEKRQPAQLSGGQQQRVALARALATSSPLLLLDEPLSNLDERLRADLRSDLSGLFKKVGAGVLIVTHDQREALALADRVAIMRSGVIVQQGAAPEVFARPATAWVAAFLGWNNIFAQGDTALLVPEQAVTIGQGKPLSILNRQTTESGETVTLAHNLGPLTLNLSRREAELAHGQTLRADLDGQRVQTVKDDREILSS